MHKRLVLILLLVCSTLFSCSTREPSVFDAIPKDTELFVETAYPEVFLGDLKGKTYVEPFLRMDADVAWIASFAARADSLLKTEPGLRTRILDSRMVLASVLVEEVSRGLLLAKLSDELSASELRRFFKAHGIVCDYRKKGKTECFYLRELDSLYVFAEDGFLGLTKDLRVVEKVYDQLDDPVKINSSEHLSRVQKTLGQHVKAHVYDHDERGWMALDVLPGNEELVMNGYCIASDSTSSLRPLKYQLPVKNSVVNILPYHTQLMLHYGMSDYASYWQASCDPVAVRALNKRYGIDVETQLLNYLSEVSFNIIGEQHAQAFVGRMNDPAAVIKFMDRLASKMGVASNQNCQGYVISDLGEKDFVPVVFGPSFSSMKRCCYAIVDQYLVITPSVSGLQEIIACYRSGRTLDLNENFKSFQQRMLESCNVTLFVSGSGNQHYVKDMMRGSLRHYLEQHPKLLDDFQAVSIQLASSKDMVYTNCCLFHGTMANDESSVGWKVNLDAPLKGKPSIVTDPTSDRRCVVAFDVQHTMYLINNKGEILWKRPLDEAPQSEVFAVDALGNGQSQYLFNTAHTLQLIDREGHDMPGYPIQLPFEASNGLSVFDYNNNKDYRLLLCGTDRLVYNFTVQGVEVEGWNHHRAEDQVTQPIQHIVAADKDYLIVNDVSGGVRILDRQGRIRIPLASDMQKSPQADIYANATNRRKGLFLTSDKEGKLLYVADDGTLNRTDFGTYSNQHFFLYEDFDGDKDPDFIFLDHQDLHVFDRFKKELFAYHFDMDIHTKPVFFNITRNKRLFGIVSEKAREIYLIDRRGKMIVNSGLVGETPFAVGSLNNDAEINLVTGVGNALFNYVIH